MQDNSRDKRGLLEIKDPLDDVANLTNSAQRMELCQTVIGGRIVDGVLYHSEGYCVEAHRRDAYSIANERVAAARPPLVSATSADGFLLSAWSTRLDVMLTT